jgi:hypothetical protein
MQALHRGHYRQETECAGGVHGGLGAHEREGKSVRTHVLTFGQAHVHIRHHGAHLNRKARTTRTRVVCPRGQIGRVRVVLGTWSA